MEQWRNLESLGIEVVGIRDTPRWMRDPVDCLWANPDDMSSCSVPRDQSLASIDPASRRGDLPSNVTVIDVNELICQANACPALIGDTVVFWDLSHLSATFAASLADALGEGFPPSFR